MLKHKMNAKRLIPIVSSKDRDTFASLVAGEWNGWEKIINL